MPNVDKADMENVRTTYFLRMSFADGPFQCNEWMVLQSYDSY